MKHSETQTSNNGLTEIQKENLEALMGLEFSGWSLCEMYLGAIRVLDNPNNPDRIPQAAHSLRELLENLPLSLGIEDPRTSTDCKQKGITRKEQINQTFDKSDPLYVLVKNRSYSNQLFCNRNKLIAIAHHNSLTANYSSLCQQDFEECDQLLNNLLAQVTEENQAKIKKILEIKEPNPDDIKELIKLIRIKGANFNYFFKEVTDPIWLEPLWDNRFFDNPPEIDGNQFVPNWEPINYLEKISDQKPEQVVKIICTLKKTKNPKILRRILAIACKLDNIDLSLILKPMVLDYLKSTDDFYDTNAINVVLKKWGSSEKGINAAREIIKFISAFLEKEKKPRIHRRGYEEILSRGVRTVAYHAPLKVANDLIKTVNAMINMCGVPQDNEPKSFDKCFSKIWFPRLDQPTSEYNSEKRILVQTLTYACVQVYNKSEPGQIDELDQELRKCRLWTFERLRHHLYASFPTKQTLPWIKEAICEYEDYSTYEHPYEFQMMIRKSCELYGCSLLTREKRKEIFNDIKAGPQSPTSQHLNTGIDFVFKAKQRQFHYKQLRPFKEVLFGEFQNYFRLLDSEQTDPLTDDSYIHPISINDSDEIVSFQTPKSVDDLKDFNDQELLDYINSWEEEEQVDQNLKKDSISELADTFQSFFTDIIVPEDLRLSFWMNNRTRIKHPIFIKSIVQGMTEIVHRKDFTRLNDLIDFCDWVLSLLDTDPGLVEEQGEISPDHPEFVPLLNAVINFIKEGVDSNLPISARQGIACLLDKVCNQANASNANNELNFYSNEIDDINDKINEKYGFVSEIYIRGVPYSLKQLNRTINDYRSKAIELLIINYWKWVRRHLPNDIVPEVTQILTKRIIREAKIPLSDPEYAILGRYFGHLYNLYPDWSSKYREYIFPHANKSSWKCSFENYLKHNPALTIMKDEYDYALENLDIFCEKNKQSKAIESLGMHIFNLYLHEAYDLRSEESLLNKFYSTLTDSHYKKHLFDMVGCCVWHGEFNEFIPKVVDFLNWRLNEGSIQEFHEFSWWMKSDCLDSDLRLRSYLQILDLLRDEILYYFIEIREILNLHQINELLVIKCLSKIAQLTPDNHRFSNRDLNDLVSILNKSLNSTDPKILNTAKVAKESFLRAETIDLNLFGDDIPSTRN